MRAFQIRNQWSRQGLTRVDLPEPDCGADEVKLQMLSASVNFRDLVVMNHGYGKSSGTLPLIPLSDGVGLVVEVGERVTGLPEGQRVCPMFMQSWQDGPADRERLSHSLGGPLDGVMADYRTFPADALAPVPDYLSNAEAATLPCAALTAWNAVITHSGLKPGDTVLILGTGGVALFALQFSKLAGYKVIITSSSDSKLAMARSLGADIGINYRQHPDWDSEVRRVSKDRGVDLVVELGGEKTLPLSLRAVRTGGSLALIGVLSGAILSANLGLIVTRQLRLQGITVGSRADFQAMCRALVQHRIRPVIDRLFDFEQLPEALDHLAAASHFGKLVVQIHEAASPEPEA